MTQGLKWICILTLHTYFPLGDIWYKGCEHCAVVAFASSLKIGIGKAMLFIFATMKLHVWVYWHPSQCLFLTWVTLCSTTIPHLAKVCWHFVSTVTAVTICNSMGRLLLLYIPKMSLYFHYVPLCNNHSENIIGQNQELWRINVGKWDFEEVYIWYCLCGWFFKNRRFEQCLQEKNSYGKDR